MPPEILNFIKTERVCVLAVEMLDGSPHAATVHFAYTEDPLILYFETYRDYRKCEPLFAHNMTRASVVVGTSESNMKTLQMDGVVTRTERDQDKELYFVKFPEKRKKAVDPKFVFFTFTPSWWRYTDWTGPAGKTIMCSTDV